MDRLKRIIVMAAIVLGATLTGCSTIEALTTPSYDLTQAQRDQINTSARLGFSGLTRFEWTYQDPDGTRGGSYKNPLRDKSEVPPVELGESFNANESLEAVAAQHGYSPRNDGETMGKAEDFVPTITNDGAYVTHTHRFVNVYGKALGTTILHNPNTSLFGNDGMVNVDEMLAFYNDPATELVSMKYDEDDISWKCVVNLEFDGNTLRTNAANSCSRFVDDSSTDQLVADLLDRYVD